MSTAQQLKADGFCVNCRLRVDDGVVFCAPICEKQYAEQEARDQAARAKAAHEKAARNAERQAAVERESGADLRTAATELQRALDAFLRLMEKTPGGAP